MKLLVLSDLHLECADLELPADLDCDVAVLAGDIAGPGARVLQWVRRSPVLQRARAVVWVLGNHEYYDGELYERGASLRRLARQCQGTPVHLLDEGQVLIDGVRFVGCTLWTDFRLHIDTESGPVSDETRGMAAAHRAMVDYRAIDFQPPGEAAPRKLTTNDTLDIHLRQREWLRRTLATPFAGRTVVVTHHGAHRRSLAPRFAADWASTAFINELPEDFFSVPSAWVHGHTHTSFDYRLGGCRVVCNPRGYVRANRPGPENPHFDAQRVLWVG